MSKLELISPLEPKERSQEAFARDLAEDLRGDRIEVVWCMVENEIHLARRDRDSGD